VEITVKQGEEVVIKIEGTDIAFEIRYGWGDHPGQGDVALWADVADNEDRRGDVYVKDFLRTHPLEERLLNVKPLEREAYSYAWPNRNARVGHSFRVWRPLSKQFLTSEGRWTIRENSAREFLDLNSAKIVMASNPRVQECPDLFEIIEMVR